jgi:exonuclease SbcD
MPIRIVHTADNHIGLSFRQYPEIRDQLIQERFLALERIVAQANQKQAHFLVVAGDLFDNLSVTSSNIRRTVAVLQQFSGQAVLVLAGNHDFYDAAAENSLWKEFENASRNEDQIFLMLQPDIFSFDCEGERINFYACPCPSRHGKEPVTAWVNGAQKQVGEWHIGVAHGNVEGIGLDADQRYFNMKPEDLKNAGLHTWLLGHIHVPYPTPGQVGTPAFFMPGIHTPDSVKVKHEGHAWSIELEQGKEILFESMRPAVVRFERIAFVVNNTADCEGLKNQLNVLASDGLVLDLQLSGRLPAEQRKNLGAWLQEKSPYFLNLSFDLADIREELDPDQLAKYWPEGSLPFDLIRELLESDPNNDDAHLAMELLENSRNQ